MGYTEQKVGDQFEQKGPLIYVRIFSLAKRDSVEGHFMLHTGVRTSVAYKRAEMEPLLRKTPEKVGNAPVYKFSMSIRDQKGDKNYTAFVKCVIKQVKLPAKADGPPMLGILGRDFLKDKQLLYDGAAGLWRLTWS